MPLAITETLGAGSGLWYEDQSTPGTYIELTNALEIGPIGAQGESVQVTPIGETTHRFIAGMETPPDLQFTFNHIPGDADYAGFLSLARSRTQINMRVQYTSGDRADFNCALLGAQMQTPESAAQLKMAVQAKQSGETTWAETP